MFSEQRIALISPYRDHCGISTYAEKLFPHLVQPFADYRIFAEKLDGAPDEDKVVRCWQRGECLLQLTKEIDAFKPDLVYIEHQYNLFPIQYEWLSLQQHLTDVLQTKVFVKLHCVYKKPVQLLDRQQSRDYFDWIENIIVHTSQASQVLKDVWFQTGAQVVPHGCNDYSPQSYSGSQQLFSFGFGLRYKGHERAIAIMQQLVAEFPFLTYMNMWSLNQRNPSSFDQPYFDQLQKQKSEAGLDKHVGFFKGFSKETDLQMFAQSCTAALFPYIESGDREVYGASGAARLAMSWGVPVVTSMMPLFDDLEGVVLKGKDEAEMAEHVRTLLRDPELRRQVTEKQRAFVEERSWKKVADEHLELFKRSFVPLPTPS